MAAKILTYSQTPFDTAPVVALFKEYNAFIGIDLTFQDFDSELAAPLPGKYSNAKGGELYIAMLNDAPVGCVAYYKFAPDIAEIKRLFVQPGAQGHGLGRRLMQAAIDGARKDGYAHVYLDSVARLKAARKLYEALGFSDIHNYNQHPFPDAYHMALAL